MKDYYHTHIHTQTHILIFYFFSLGFLHLFIVQRFSCILFGLPQMFFGNSIIFNWCYLLVAASKVDWNSNTKNNFNTTRKK